MNLISIRRSAELREPIRLASLPFSLLFALFFLAAPHPSYGQRKAAAPDKGSRPDVSRHLVDPRTHGILSNEISGAIALQQAMRLESTSRLPGHYEALNAAADLIQERCQQYGLRSLRRVEQTGYFPTWSANSAELWMTAPESLRLASVDEIPWSLASFSQSGLVEADLVDVGSGVSSSDYRSSVSGNVVLAHGPAHLVIQQAIWRRGALGAICTTSSGDLDAVPNGFLSPPPNGELPKGSFVYFVSRRKAERLRGFLEGRSDPSRRGSGSQKVTIRSRIDAQESAPGKQPWIEAVIPGSEPELPEILVCARLEESPRLSSSGSTGCASTLEIARSLRELIETQTLPRPRRSIRFWWTTGISGVYEAFLSAPATRRKILAAIHVDSLGEDDGNPATSFVGLPLFRPSFIEDYALGVLDETNLWIRRNEIGRGPSEASTPEYPVNRGWRPPLAHDAFCDSAIAVPAVSFANLHSRGARNPGGSLAAIELHRLRTEMLGVGSLVYSLAASDPKHLFTSVNRLVVSSRARLSQLFERSAAILLASEDPWRDSRNLLYQGLLFERTSLSSLSALFAGSGQDAINVRRDNLWAEGAVLMTDLSATYSYLSGVENPGEPDPSKEEKRHQLQYPAFAGDLAKHFENRRGSGAMTPDLMRSFPSYRPLASFVLSAVDGRRGFPEIYRLAQAAQLADAPFAEAVTIEKIVELIKTAVQTGAVELRDRRRR